MYKHTEFAALEAICVHIAFALNQVAKAILITDSSQLLACLFLFSTPSLRWAHVHRLDVSQQLSVLLTTHTMLSEDVGHDSTIISRATSTSNCHNLEYLLHDTSVCPVKGALLVVADGCRGGSADHSAVMPDIFTEHCVSGEEYAWLEKHFKFVNVNPPDS